MLYLVEYADYDSQEMLGVGNSYHSGTLGVSPSKSGECNSLGMKSGTLNNDGKHSMIYRGIEDIVGNADQFIDGINVKDYQAYINYNPDTYEVNQFSGDYHILNYQMPTELGWISKIGYDKEHPLVSIPTEVTNDNSNVVNDYYRIKSGNQVAVVGGHIWRYIDSNGMWHYDFDILPTIKSVLIGARLLRYA